MHLRELSKSSNFFYKFAINPKFSNNESSCKDVVASSGDIWVNLFDGTKIRCEISETPYDIKLKVHRVFGIPLYDLQVYPGRINDHSAELPDDWRSLSGAGFEKDD